MALLVAMIVGSLLMGFGAYARRWRRLPLDFNYLVKLLLVSYGLGVFLGFTLIPSLVLAIGFALWGGRLDDHLIGDAASLLVGLVIGVLLGAMWAIKGYRDTVRS